MKSCRSCSASNSPVASRFTRPISPRRRCTSSDFFSSDSTESSSVSSASASSGSRRWPSRMRRSASRDPPLDVAAEAVLVLVRLAEAIELGRGLAPRAVDRGLRLRRRSARPRPRASRAVDAASAASSAFSIACSAASGPLRPPRGRRAAGSGSCAASASRSRAELDQTGVERRPVAAERLDRDARGDRRLRRAGELGHLLGHGLGIAETLAPRGHAVIQTTRRVAGGSPPPCAGRASSAAEDGRAARRRT